MDQISQKVNQSRTQSLKLHFTGHENRRFNIRAIYILVTDFRKQNRILITF